MRARHFVGLDVHCKFTEVAVVTEGGRLTKRWPVPSTIPALMEALESVSRPHVALEEGPMADWLVRNLASHVEQITACDPRHNHLIAKDSDKDDPIDAEKLAQLLRGGYVKPVHHSESWERTMFKRHVALYHDRVRHRVREANRIMAYFRRFGVFVRNRAFAEAEKRRLVLDSMPDDQVVRFHLRLMFSGYDLATEHIHQMRRRLVQLARRYEPIKRFVQLPGVHWIRAATFFAYVDTPWRFKSKSALWKYMGIGLERRRSGGGAERLHVPHYANRVLKCAILGAAKSAIASGGNPFADQYERWIHDGLTPRIARRSVARSQAVTMWSLWKNGSVYKPQRVGVPVTASTVETSP
ncbi:MAG: transposase [Planctomycetes bacterium]|nr:transposase [Planctomycetota bacterium]MBI3832869.1 transposase [Planctomycetota bacterium]